MKTPPRSRKSPTSRRLITPAAAWWKKSRRLQNLYWKMRRPSRLLTSKASCPVLRLSAAAPPLKIRCQLPTRMSENPPPPPQLLLPERDSWLPGARLHGRTAAVCSIFCKAPTGDDYRIKTSTMRCPE
ncbi:uncharacterized protein LOC127254256 isoform X1 [Andrographis paniculata]|uniref:uncharacterized protein LOC127254256 isoform X1 n=1 Tax=Andrographis paniculata TaxID=175694 RepID=UPI0021E899BD|nr:uncharacterized protein LOC127254256 isoform X1 [Andrographis paniculata]XP_051135228.1 uncharacterized protein LOC127254256 isoform X1 [Andrographis paniculata]